jgi:hypothetical protein
VKRSFRVPADADLAAAMKRAALAAIPKAEGWRLVVFSVGSVSARASERHGGNSVTRSDQAEQ